jgi:hypothetical protein
MVYRAVLDEISQVPEVSASESALRTREVPVPGSDIAALNRTAAVIAAMLVGQNVRLPQTEFAGEADPGWPPQDS